MRLLLLSAAVVCIAAPTMAQSGFPEPPPGMSDARPRQMPPPPDRETLAEMQARMGQMFDRFDTDHDGVVTRDQLQNARGGRMLERADADEDGRVTREELGVAVTALFRQMDKDGDGVVTAAERPRMRPGG